MPKYAQTLSWVGPTHPTYTLKIHYVSKPLFSPKHKQLEIIFKNNYKQAFNILNHLILPVMFGMDIHNVWVKSL